MNTGTSSVGMFDCYHPPEQLHCPVDGYPLAEQ